MMATKAKPKQSPEWARGVFEALVAAKEESGFCPQQDAIEEIADALDVPVLFVEASQTYDLGAVEALARWWPDMRSPAERLEGGG